MKTLKEMWERLQDRLAEERRARQTINELSKLSDLQLRDMGITRCDIYALAMENKRG